MCLSKQAENKNKKKEKKIIIILVVNAAWKLFESGTESTQLLNEFNSLAPHSFIQRTLYSLSRQFNEFSPFICFFSVYLSCVHFSSPLIH